MSRRTRGAIASGLVLVALTWITLHGLLFYRPLPIIDGYYRFLGLDQRAEIVRDAFGIPRIEAGTLHDLFFLQGYVTAQDRFAQMEAMRNAADIPESAVPDGAFRDALEAYAAGVTKYIDQHVGARALPAEIALRGPQPRPWTVSDSARIARYLTDAESMTCVAIGGNRTVRGGPLLWAQLIGQAPSPGFYTVGLHAGTIRAVGASLPGIPGVVAGHNGAVAWSVRQGDAPAGPLDAARGLVGVLSARSVGEAARALSDVPFCAADARDVAGPTYDHVDRPIDIEWMRSEIFRPRRTDAGAVVAVDLADLDASRAALSTGQSGHSAALHYGDQAQLWSAGQMHRLAWTRDAVARTEGRLVLRPR